MSYWSDWVRNNLHKERLKRGNVCAICGKPGTDQNPLDFMHVQHTPMSGRGASRGRVERLYDIKRHPGAYRLGHHKTCHLQYDAGSTNQ